MQDKLLCTLVLPKRYLINLRIFRHPNIHDATCGKFTAIDGHSRNLAGVHAKRKER